MSLLFWKHFVCILKRDVIFNHLRKLFFLKTQDTGIGCTQDMYGILKALNMEPDVIGT